MTEIAVPIGAGFLVWRQRRLGRGSRSRRITNDAIHLQTNLAEIRVQLRDRGNVPLRRLLPVQLERRCEGRLNRIEQLLVRAIFQRHRARSGSESGVVGMTWLQDEGSDTRLLGSA